MMWFRNLKVFRLGGDWPREIADSLAKHKFEPCAASAMSSYGWIPPRGNPEEYVVTVGGMQLIALGIEEKLLPSSVIRLYIEQRLEEVEERQGFKPGRGQIREVKEQVTAELLPRAFVKRRTTHAWIDNAGRWMVIDCGTHSKADEIIEQIRRTFGLAPLLPIHTQMSPASAMTEWLAAGEAPSPFTVDRECELRSMAEERSTVKYTRHALETEDIRHHLEEGKKATRLAMTWNGRISFVLTEDLFIKRLAFLDLLKEQSEKAATENQEDIFEADFIIMSGEVSQMIPQVIEALGGEVT